MDPEAYLAALDTFKPGDVCIIFTPDDTHFDIAMAAVERGLHVMVTKPCVKELSHHIALAEAAKKKGVLVQVEVHKRFDPIYVDARDRIKVSAAATCLCLYLCLCLPLCLSLRAGCR